jgi:hypothetical protein
MRLGAWSLRLAVALAIIYSICASFLYKNKALLKFAEEQVIATFETAYACHFRGKAVACDLWRCTLTMQDVEAEAAQGEYWSWHADTFILKFSPLSLLSRNVIDLHAEINQCGAYSVFSSEGVPLIVHLMGYAFGKPKLPISLQSVAVEKAEVLLESENSTIAGHCALRVFVKDSRAQLAGNFNTFTYCQNKKQLVYVPDIDLNCVVRTDQLSKIRFDMKGEIDIAHRAAPLKCYLNGKWDGQEGTVSIESTDTALSGILKNIRYSADMGVQARLYFKLPIDLLSTMLGGGKAPELHGSLQLENVLAYQNAFHTHGKVLLKEVGIGGYDIGDFESSFSIGADTAYGYCKGSQGLLDQLTGSWLYNHSDKSCMIAIANESEEAQGSPIKHILVNGLIDPEGALDLTYECTCTSPLSKNALAIKGKMQGLQGHYRMQGSIEKNKFQVRLNQRAGESAVLQGWCMDEQHRLLWRFKSAEVLKRGQLEMDVMLLQYICRYILGYAPSGEGSMHIGWEVGAAGIEATAELHKGFLVIPGTYTVLTGFAAHLAYDVQQRLLHIQQMRCKCDKGGVYAHKGMLSLDSNGKLASAYLSLLIKNLFITTGRDLFMQLNGNLCIHKKDDAQPHIEGTVIIDKGRIGKNILGSEWQKSALGIKQEEGPQATLDLHIINRKSIQVKTPFLLAESRCNVQVKGTLQHPIVTGEIRLPQGTLAFPYRPLHITRGSISLVPHQIGSSLIELQAEGKVRKYHITLQCAGTLQAPDISLSSDPLLSEEQIITLLLSGSEEGVLSSVVPALLMDKLQDLLFGTEESLALLNTYLSTILGPFTRIRFIPSFADQTARGGFRAAIEVEVNDQLRGSIQKNFSLSEDVKYEVEYIVSDDISMRAIRDERGDTGAEIEMRWKF